MKLKFTREPVDTFNIKPLSNAVTITPYLHRKLSFNDEIRFTKVYQIVDAHKPLLDGYLATTDQAFTMDSAIEIIKQASNKGLRKVDAPIDAVGTLFVDKQVCLYPIAMIELAGYNGQPVIVNLYLSNLVAVCTESEQSVYELYR